VKFNDKVGTAWHTSVLRVFSYVLQKVVDVGVDCTELAVALHHALVRSEFLPFYSQATQRCSVVRVWVLHQPNHSQEPSVVGMLLALRRRLRPD
jgi:hypothetical protein